MVFSRATKFSSNQCEESPPRGALFLRGKNPEMVQPSLHEGGREREVGPFIKHDSQAHCPTRSGLVPRSRGQKAPPRCDNVSLPLLHEQPNSSGEYHIRRLITRVRVPVLAVLGAVEKTAEGQTLPSRALRSSPSLLMRSALHLPSYSLSLQSDCSALSRSLGASATDKRLRRKSSPSSSPSSFLGIRVGVTGDSSPSARLESPSSPMLM